jgi:hypothetical protein
MYCVFHLHLIILLKITNSSFVGIATYRFWIQIVGGRCHGYTSLVSICSGNCSSSFVLKNIPKPLSKCTVEAQAYIIRSLWSYYPFFSQDQISKQISILYHWPKVIQIPILDGAR